MLNLLLQEDAVTPGNAVAPDTLATLLTLYTMCACIPHTACEFNNLCFPVSISSCVLCLRIKFVFNLMHPSIYLSFKCYLPFLVFTTSTWDACNKWGILDFITLSRAAFVSFGAHGESEKSRTLLRRPYSSKIIPFLATYASSSSHHGTTCSFVATATPPSLVRPRNAHNSSSSPAGD